MSSVVSNITTAIKTEIASELGASFSELGYVIDLTKNSFRQNENAYGVLPGEVSQVSGVNRFATYEQEFTIKIMKAYGDSSVSDQPQRAKALELFELMHRLNSRLVKNKAGSPANVMNVSDLNISEPQYLTNSKAVYVEASLTLTYRVSLN